MEVLRANTGANEQFIISTHTYVKVWDYGKKHILRHFKDLSGNIVWVWVDVSPGAMSDMNELGYITFEEAVNKAVNNPYCTVYNFETVEEMAHQWGEIRYVDTITTTYKSEE